MCRHRASIICIVLAEPWSNARARFVCRPSLLSSMSECCSPGVSTPLRSSWQPAGRREASEKLSHHRFRGYVTNLRRGASKRAAVIALTGSLSLGFHSAFPLDLRAEVSNPCVAQAERAELRQALPRALLRAIALVESGWSPAGRRIRQPWPWAVGSRGRARFFATKSAAVEFVETLHAAGEWNIDVGCMQINLHYHGDAFDTFADALDPARNVDYAANLLSKLAAETGSWRAALGRYHSADPGRAVAYVQRVEKFWGQDHSAQLAGPAMRSRPPDAGQGMSHLLTETFLALARARALTMPAPPEILSEPGLRFTGRWAELARDLAAEAE